MEKGNGLSSLWRKARPVEKDRIALRDAVAERIVRRIVMESGILYEGNDMSSESNALELVGDIDSNLQSD